MKTKQFHLSDVLSVVTGLSLSTRDLDGVRDILNFMTGEELLTTHIPIAAAVAKPYLLEQFPQLSSPEMDFAVGELQEMLKTPSGEKEPRLLILGWLSKFISGNRYGVEIDEMLAVKPFPKEAVFDANAMTHLVYIAGRHPEVIGVRIG
jgi:hypothetical protein